MVNVEHPHMREFGLYKGLLKRLRTTINEPAGTQKSGEGNLAWVRVPPPAQQKTATSTQKGAEVILSAPYFCLLRLVLRAARVLLLHPCVAKRVRSHPDTRREHQG